jgi:hypothetical protein
LNDGAHENPAATDAVTANIDRLWAVFDDWPVAAAEDLQEYLAGKVFSDQQRFACRTRRGGRSEK